MRTWKKKKEKKKSQIGDILYQKEHGENAGKHIHILMLKGGVHDPHGNRRLCFD